MCEGFEVGKVVCVIKELQEDQYTQSIVIKGKCNTKRGQFIWYFRTHFKDFCILLVSSGHGKTFFFFEAGEW